jgi:hypothetical protein
MLRIKEVECSSIGAAKGAGLPQKLFGLAPPHNCPRTLADLRGLLLDREKLLTALNDDPKACREASRFDASQEDKHCGVQCLNNPLDVGRVGW